MNVEELAFINLIKQKDRLSIITKRPFYLDVLYIVLSRLSYFIKVDYKNRNTKNKLILFGNRSTNIGHKTSRKSLEIFFGNIIGLCTRLKLENVC